MLSDFKRASLKDKLQRLEKERLGKAKETVKKGRKLEKDNEERYGK